MRYFQFFLISLSLLIFGCSTYTISKGELLSQLKENQNRKEVSQYIPIQTGIASIFLSGSFESNQIEKILCYDSDGSKVYLYPNKDTLLEITKKSDGDVVKMYFDTVFLIDGKIVGLRSRLIQSMVREVDIDDIGKIEISVELPSTEEYHTK